MKATYAKFRIGNTAVEFNGDQIHLYHEAPTKGRPISGVKSIDNPWTSRTKEDADVISGREYRPNVNDAKRLVKRYLQEP